MSLPTNIELDTDGSVARLRLARPDKLNALSSDLMRELIDAAARLDSMPNVRAVVVSGDGAAFCAGFDAAELESMRPITIAGLHRTVLGGGLVIAACCDLRNAADDTIFSIPEVDLGIPLLWGAIPRLVREIGPAHTKDLVMTCRTFTAAEADRMGFLNRVVPAGAVGEAAETMAAQVADRPPIPVEMTKRQVASALGAGVPISDEEALLASSADPDARARRAASLSQFRSD